MRRWWWRYAMAAALVALAILAVDTLLGSPIPPRIPLREVPSRIGAWTGWTEPIDSSYLQRARPDEVLHRRYLDEAGQPIVLYIGYYKRQSARAQSQSACYGDCQVLHSGLEVIDLTGGSITVNRVLVQQNGIPMVGLYWYQQGDRLMHDSYQTRLALLRRAVRARRSDGALIRVTAPIVTSTHEARERSVAFLKRVFPLLRSYLPD